GLANVFGVVVILGWNERDRWKPNPEPLARALAALAVAGPEAAHVGDNPAKDFRGARALGMRTVRIRRPGGLHANREPADEADAPDAEIGNLDELESALGMAPEEIG
ncbi:MAG: HAD hydrolase-like protein, partial [Anaerolineales bacterium]